MDVKKEESMQEGEKLQQVADVRELEPKEEMSFQEETDAKEPEEVP